MKIHLFLTLSLSSWEIFNPPLDDVDKVFWDIEGTRGNESHTYVATDKTQKCFHIDAPKNWIFHPFRCPHCSCGKWSLIRVQNSPVTGQWGIKSFKQFHTLLWGIKYHSSYEASRDRSPHRQVNHSPNEQMNAICIEKQYYYSVNPSFVSQCIRFTMMLPLDRLLVDSEGRKCA